MIKDKRIKEWSSQITKDLAHMQTASLCLAYPIYLTDVFNVVIF